MIEYKTALKKILLMTELDGLEDQVKSIIQYISEKDLAGFFIESIYLKSVVNLIIEDHWTQSKNSSSEIYFDRFIKPYINTELKYLLFLHSFFQNSNIEGMQTAAKVLSKTEILLLSSIKSKSSDFKKTFLQFALQRMSDFFELEHQQSSIAKKNLADGRLSLYRSFDSLDKIFGIEYRPDEVSSPDERERLFEAAGLGVQSSYDTTILALKYLNLAKGARFIDLGSGYGRIGLVFGLLRPDVQFIGYEFVKERVEIANTACVNLKLDRHVQFVTQDLSQTTFKIPLSDAYYIFDSFTEATYNTIMDQLQEMTLQKRIAVVTKGNAKLWMKNKFWTEPQEFNNGNLCIFRSRAMPFRT